MFLYVLWSVSRTVISVKEVTPMYMVNTLIVVGIWLCTRLIIERIKNGYWF